MPVALTRNCVAISCRGAVGWRRLLEGAASATEEPLRGLLLRHRLRREVLVAHEQVDALVDHGAHVHRAADAQVEVLLEPAVVVGDDLLGRQGAVGGVEAHAELGHARQVVDAVRGAEAEGRPAVLPRSAGAGSAVEHDEVLVGDELEPSEVVGDGEAGLPGSDHHDLHAFRARHHLTISACVAGRAHSRVSRLLGSAQDVVDGTGSPRSSVLNWQPDEFLLSECAG